MSRRSISHSARSSGLRRSARLASRYRGGGAQPRTVVSPRSPTRTTEIMDEEDESIPPPRIIAAPREEQQPHVPRIPSNMIPERNRRLANQGKLLVEIPRPRELQEHLTAAYEQYGHLLPTTAPSVPEVMRQYSLLGNTWAVEFDLLNNRACFFTMGQF